MSDIKYHWLVSGQVITRDPKGVERAKSFNTLLTTAVDYVTRQDIARAQNALMHRFVNEAEQIKGAKIIDVFIPAISSLGMMTDEEFNAGFVSPTAPKVDNSQTVMELH